MASDNARVMAQRSAGEKDLEVTSLTVA